MSQSQSKKALRVHDLCGAYKVARFVGRDRAVEIYEAVHEPSGDRVTLSILSRKAAADEAARRRFQAETELFGALDHPNVLKALGTGEVDGLPWRAMELAAGGSLRARLEGASGPMSIAVALCFARQIADALGALHAAGVAHGELSPESILLTDIDEVKLGDLGAAPLSPGQGARSAVARRAEARGYSAPEQIGGAAADVAGDVFAAGAVLREMLAGRGAAASERALPDFVRDVVDKATADRPGDRYASMAALGDAVNDAWNDLLEQNRGGAELEQALAMLAQVLSQGQGEEGDEGGDPAAEFAALIQALTNATKRAGEGE